MQQPQQVSNTLTTQYPTGVMTSKQTTIAIGGQAQDTSVYKDYKIIRRNGSLMTFEPQKISVALMKAFLAVKGNHGAATAAVRDSVSVLTEAVIRALMRSRPQGGTFHIEDVQDQVELQLMRQGHQDVARAYVLYREKRAQERTETSTADTASHIKVKQGDTLVPLPLDAIIKHVVRACGNLENVDPKKIVEETLRNLYDGVTSEEIDKALILATRTLIETEPAYTKVAAYLLLHAIDQEVIETLGLTKGSPISEAFKEGLDRGIKEGLLDPRLRQFKWDVLEKVLKPIRDYQFDYLGLQTLYDRYFLHVGGKRIELPQTFFMRIAMGLALNETSRRESKAIEFYNVLSSFDFMSSTPTLFNAGTTRPQLSSCYLTTVADDLDGIYDAVKDNAMLSKFAGGLGNDWTRVRAMGSRIKGTNGESQGVVPFLKVVNDTAVAVNQGGKRKGAVCCYLETWHLDIEEFLELRKNTGDDRRRTHDMNTANWVPDLFMDRVMKGQDWTLFSPSTCPDLHDLYGPEFNAAYRAYEKKAEQGLIKPFKVVRAVDLWRKMLSMLFETGHPWITFKDPCNIRSPQQHVGVVHSSNLCTEITLNTSDSEIAVCNLGSVNLANHLTDNNTLDTEKMQETIQTAMRMLDNVIDINYYAVKKARDSNLRHRPVGLGMMGFQDALYKMRIPYASDEAMDFADKSAETLCYYAYLASSELAKERGAYPTYKGSTWSQGKLPIDTFSDLCKIRQQEYGQNISVVIKSTTMDWEYLREAIKANGMRNSNCVAIAPTATISNIIGVDASIEPCFANLAVKSNLSGEFTVVNEYLVNDLKEMGLWDEVMLVDLKHFDGVLARIDRIPQDLKKLYATAFEIDPVWLIDAASRRQKWVDQAQSLNLYIGGVSGKVLDETYKLAWAKGLKTTYYLRSQGATKAEKSTIAPSLLNAVSAMPESEGKMCSINNPDCESCQ